MLENISISGLKSCWATMNYSRKKKVFMNRTQDAAAYVQNGIGMMASTAERIHNLTNFLVPFMSWITVAALTAAALVLYLIPIR